MPQRSWAFPEAPRYPGNDQGRRIAQIVQRVRQQGQAAGADALHDVHAQNQHREPETKGQCPSGPVVMSMGVSVGM
jgi:hypothetical protein